MSSQNSLKKGGVSQVATSNDIKIEARRLYLARNTQEVVGKPSGIDGKGAKSTDGKKVKKNKKNKKADITPIVPPHQEREIATEMFELSDSEDEEPPKVIPWKCPVDIVGLEDVENPDIIESLQEPMLASEYEQGNYKYEYASKKAIDNLRSMFRQYGEMLEEHEANNV